MIEYTCFPLDGTAEATVEVESVAASESSDIEKDFSSHSDKRGEGERENTELYSLSSPSPWKKQGACLL